MLPLLKRMSVLLQLREFEAEFANCDWPLWARKDQYPETPDWKTWVLLGGRGAGKTRAGAEWLKHIALSPFGAPDHCGGRVALIGETYNDVRDIMIEGHSGLLSVHRREDRPRWNSTQRKLEWPNGVIGQAFSSRDPDGLRGSQFGAVWCDGGGRRSTCRHCRADNRRPEPIGNIRRNIAGCCRSRSVIVYLWPSQRHRYYQLIRDESFCCLDENF